MSQVLRRRAIGRSRQHRRLPADSLTEPLGAIASVPTMPVQTFRDLALDCPFSTRDLAAALWVEGPGVAVERASASAVRPAALRQRRRTRYVFVASLPSPSATLAAPDEGAQTVPTEKMTTEKGKRRIRREMLSPYEMSLVQTAFGMSAQHTTSEPLREALFKIAKKLTNIDRMIVEEDLD